MGDHQSYKIECMGKKNEAYELKEMTVFELLQQDVFYMFHQGLRVKERNIFYTLDLLVYWTCSFNHASA